MIIARDYISRLLTISLPVLLLGAVFSAPVHAVGTGPEISVTASTAAAAHFSGDPLLIYVSVFNGEATDVGTENANKRDLVKRYKETDKYGALSEAKKKEFLEEYKEVEPPVYTLGSDEKSVSELLRFEVRDSKGDKVEIEVKPLKASQAEKAAVRLDGKSTVFLFFGIDPASLAPLAEGTFAIRADIDTTGEKGMWRGKKSSRAVTVKLTSKKGTETVGRLYMAGTYYRLDEEYEKVELYAEKLLKKEPDAVGGWILKGDAHKGLGRPEKALSAFEKALELYMDLIKKEKPEIVEPPSYIFKRINELERKLGIIVEE